MNYLKKNKGITLIALVVSIIVLLILAGVSISAITGNESAMEKATEAREKNEQGAELDAIKLAVVDAVAKGTNGYVTLTDLNNALNDTGFNDATDGIDENAGKFVVTGKKGREYIIEKNGQVTANDPQPVTAIAQKNTGNIQVQQGKYVKLRKAINTTPASNIEALTYTKLSGDENITLNTTTGVVSATADAVVGRTATIKIAGSISTDVSLTVTVEVIAPVKPHYDEPIILGNAIAGVGPENQDGTPNTSNEDDWKILCYDEDKQKIYAILDSFLPASVLNELEDINLDSDGTYGIKAKTETQTRNQFIAELTNKDNWRKLISNTNTEIEVYGALPKVDDDGNATELTMDYAKNKRGTTLYFTPLNASALYGYYLASPSSRNDLCMTVIATFSGMFGRDDNRFGFTGSEFGLCPVAILPASIVEQNEDGIWEVK